MTPIFQLSADHVTAEAALDPIAATLDGVTTDATALTDLTPDGFAARADLARRTLAALAKLSPSPARTGSRPRICATASKPSWPGMSWTSRSARYRRISAR